jgi:hypothetical protein
VVQRNHRGIEKVMRKFQAFYGYIRSVLNDSRIKEDTRRRMWAEYASTARFYGHILANRESGKPPHESMFGVKFKKLNDLASFGSTAVISTTNKRYRTILYHLLGVKTRQVKMSMHLIWSDKTYES